MKKLPLTSLCLTLLLLAACNSGEGTAPSGADTMVATATSAAVVEPTVAVDVSVITETIVITDSIELTDATDITDSEAMTATDAILDSMELTDSAGISGASALTSTLDLTDTQGMTETGMEEAPRELILASDLQGYNVQNPAGESLGSVQDLVFNLEDGQIVLVTVEYGGFLDIGDKVFPVPLSAFRFEQIRNEIPAVAPAVPGAVVTDTNAMTDTAGIVTTESMAVATSLILDIPEETFENAPGFADDFPVLTEPATVGDIESFYRDLGEDVIGRPIAETDLEALAGRAVKLSDIDGGNVQNPEGEGVGEINDMLIDLQAGKIEYLILSFGGFLGIGENRYAIPVDAFEVIPSSADIEAGAPELVLDIIEEQLEGAPVFDELDLSNFDWDIDARDFWLNR